MKNIPGIPRRFEAKPGHDQSFMDFMKGTIEIAEKLKKSMDKRGLTAAKAKCPRCAGFIHGRLAGPKKHLHMACDGPCGTRMMS